MGVVGFSGQMGRYLSGLCVATLGLCAAGWLALAPVAFGYRSAGRPGAPFVLRYRPAGAPWTGAARLDVAVGAALAAAGFGGFFTALAGRVRELYAQAGTAQEPCGAPE